MKPLKKRKIRRSLLDRIKGLFKKSIYEFNWIGMTWMKKFNKGLLPTLNQISKGLVGEAMVQLTIAMGDMNNQQAVFTA